MDILLSIVVLALAFVGSRWSGRLLDRHYADRLEVVAILTIAGCVFVPIALASAGMLVDGAPLKVALALAVCSGLLTGRGREAV